MALWSVALFGYYKEQSLGWEQRAKPGDVIAFRPASEANLWTPHERKRFLIITVSDLESSQLSALCEPYYDISTLPSVEFAKIGDVLYPMGYFNKRRFGISLEDLSSIGVNTSRMLDAGDLYVPEDLVVSKETCYDRMTSRNVLPTDNLRLIDPVIVTQEMKGEI